MAVQKAAAAFCAFWLLAMQLLAVTLSSGWKAAVVARPLLEDFVFVFCSVSWQALVLIGALGYSLNCLAWAWLAASAREVGKIYLFVVDWLHEEFAREFANPRRVPSTVKMYPDSNYRVGSFDYSNFKAPLYKPEPRFSASHSRLYEPERPFRASQSRRYEPDPPFNARQSRQPVFCEDEDVVFIKQINKRDILVRPLALRAFGNVERLKAAARGFRGDIIFGGKGANLEIKKGDLDDLLENGWLGDEVINGYLGLLQARANEFASPQSMLKVQFLSTFLFTKLTGCTTGFNFEGVRRWTRNVNLFDQDLVLLPVNLHAAKHWVLVAVYMKEKVIEYFDSMPGYVKASDVENVLTVVERYMHAMAKAANNIEFATAAWKKYQMVEGLPVQDDATACGVFLCTYADLLARGLRPPFRFSAADVEGLRNGIALCLMKGVLPRTSEVGSEMRFGLTKG